MTMGFRRFMYLQRETETPGPHFGWDLTIQVDLSGAAEHHQRYGIGFIWLIGMHDTADGGTSLAWQNSWHVTP